MAALLIACSSPLGDDDGEAETATTEPSLATASEALDIVAAITATEITPEIERSPDELTPTETEPAATSTRMIGTAMPTPTDEPLPTDGAEMRIDGDAITMIIQGSDTGRTMYAIAGGAFWRTNDGGRSWSEAGDGDVDNVQVAINEQNVIYTGDRGGCGRGFSFQDFRRSTDAGRTWESVEASADFEPMLAYEASGAAYVYGSSCGLSVSVDGGSTWQAVPDLNGEEIFAVATERTDPMTQIVVVAATEGGTGRLFLFDTSDPARPLFIGALAQFWGDAAVDWRDGRIVLAHAHLVGVSDDGGETWNWSRNGLDDATFSVDPLFEPLPESEMEPFRRFDIVRIDPTNRDRIWIGGSRGAFLSTDGGETWERVGDDVAITGIVISTLTDRVLISSAEGTRLWNLDVD